jgi:hypothetical protein
LPHAAKVSPADEDFVLAYELLPIPVCLATATSSPMTIKVAINPSNTCSVADAPETLLANDITTGSNAQTKTASNMMSVMFIS